MATNLDRIDPSMLEAGELEQLRKMLGDQPRLKGREGYELPLPDPIFHMLLRVADAMAKGQTVLLMPEDETFTTQAAADYLGVSRPHVVDLIKRGEIPHHKVGTHRRVKLSDLRAYEHERDAHRRRSLDELFENLDRGGLYKCPAPNVCHPCSHGDQPLDPRPLFVGESYPSS